MVHVKEKQYIPGPLSPRILGLVPDIPVIYLCNHYESWQRIFSYCVNNQSINCVKK